MATAPIRTDSMPVLAKPWAVIKVFMPKRQLDENGADGVDVHVADAVLDGVFAGAERQEEIPVSRSATTTVSSTDMRICTRKQLPSVFSADVVISLAHKNGGPRRAADSPRRRRRR